MAVYSARCMACHNGATLHSCPKPEVSRLLAKAAAAGKTAAVNCIDCHMPALPSNKITLQINGEEQLVHDPVRTHRIAIYQ